MNQGLKANISGNNLEERIASMLSSKNIEFIKQHKFTSIYGTNAKMDFYITSLDLAIEAKNQEVSGSVAEKLPYVLLNLAQHPASNGLLVLGGNYWKNKIGIHKFLVNFSNVLTNTKISFIFEEELERYLIEQTNSRS